MDILAILLANREYIELAIGLICLVWSSARGAISGTSEIMQKSQLTEAQAIQKASDLMGIRFPYFPEFVRKAVIQWAFNSMKKAVSKK